jgi:pimeloyl-ACP methyl ester carboxylesterase
MVRKAFSILIIIISSLSCQKESITLSASADDVFYLENAAAAMRIEVRGNTQSKAFVLIVHGGPGATAFFYDKNYYKNHIENKLAMVFWDQRNAGASQGNNNGNNLHLDQIVEDLKKVIELLKYRYGQDIRIYILGHSWGGLVTSAFLTKANYQQMIRGWICADGSHNYPLNDTLTRDKLFSVGRTEISLNKNADKWQDIIDYCTQHPGPFTFDESMQLENYATIAETLMDSAKQVSIKDYIDNYILQKQFPLTSIAMNYLYSTEAVINDEISTANYSPQMYKVTVPVLLLWGKYDFICPEGLADDIYSRIGSTIKKKVISPISGHDMMLVDKKLFCDEVANFVEQNP